MESKTAELFGLAKEYCAELSTHHVLTKFWPRLSLVLKGSVARGNSDKYSDIDFVFFCAEDDYQSIIRMYHSLNLTPRNDGVFMPLGDWAGHYHFETFEKLTGYFTSLNYPQIWEYQNVVVLHDPDQRYQQLLSAKSTTVFADPLPAIKRAYLDMQLTIDWLRHPLMRGDQIAVILHCSTIIQGVCRICYLMDSVCYPHDKWLFEYLNTTRFGKSHSSFIKQYATRLSDDIQNHLELESYPQYTMAAELIGDVATFIARHHGESPWLNEWYLYV